MEQKVFLNTQNDSFNELLKSVGKEQIFLVRGKSSYTASGAEFFIQEFFEKQPEAFFDFKTNPQLNDLEKGLKLFKKGQYKMILAIGGGSVLDMAKLISVFAHQKSNLTDLILGKTQIEPNYTPLIAIPTTAGTGSEATKFAVLYIGKTKYSVETPVMLPAYVYLSPEFTASANAYLTACTGLDAFCQAVESVWSVNATESSQKFALKAIQIIWENLPKAVSKNNKDAKNKMQEAAYLAGKAINITKTTAPHALSYAFTSYYKIPHGHAVALSLPFFLEFNRNVEQSNCTDSNGFEAVQNRINRILKTLNLKPENAKSAFIQFIESLGIQLNIAQLISNFDRSIIIENVNYMRLKNNPRMVTPETIEKFIGQSIK
jgi:alcohol dehydrogenase class IV